jgi:uncharacterized membrane protein YebE (DUF533 family)
MANFVDLLGSLMQNNLPQASDQRIGNALQGLQTHFGRMAGGQAGGGDLLGGLMGIARGVADNLSRSPAQAGGLGALLGSVLGGGTSSAKGAMAGGTLAMLAGIAFKALTEAGQSPAAGLSGDELPLGLRAPQTPAERQALESTAQLVVRGMINIAKSDGSVSVEEVQRIIGKIQTAGMDADAQEWLMAELRRPLDLDAFIAEIPSPEVAAEVYSASLLAVDLDTPQERDYLRQFAEKTGLHPIVVQHIHQTLGVPA